MAARNKGAKGADLPCGLPSGKPVKAVAKNSFLYKANVLKVNNVADLGKFNAKPSEDKPKSPFGLWAGLGTSHKWANLSLRINSFAMAGAKSNWGA
jgi:hypothetical protein